MMRRTWMLAPLLILAGSTPLARGDDTFRLDTRVDEVTVTTLAYDGQSETLLMRGVRVGHGIHHHHGFHHHHFGHHHLHHHHFVGHRGIHGRGWGGIGWGGWGGPGWGSWYAGWGGYGGGGYYAPLCYPSVYYTPVCYSTPAYCGANSYPVSGDVAAGLSARIYRPAIASPSTNREHLPGPQPYPADRQGSTLPYDGGPVNPVPLPKNIRPAPMNLTPGDGRLISIPSTPAPEATGSSGFAYSAYGESQHGR